MIIWLLLSPLDDTLRNDKTTVSGSKEKTWTNVQID